MSERFSGEVGVPLCVDCRSPMFDDDEPDAAGRCSGCQDFEPAPRPACSDCGMRHEPEDTAACIEGHGDDPYPLVDRLDQGWLSEDDIQVTIHGKYGRGPMPVEFRDAMVEMVRLVKEAIDRGELPKRRRQPAQLPPSEVQDGS